MIYTDLEAHIFFVLLYYERLSIGDFHGVLGGSVARSVCYYDGVGSYIKKT